MAPPQVIPEITTTTPTFDKEAVRRLTKKGVVTLIFDEKVYDVTKFMKFHPGGDHLIKTSAGTDVTEVMIAMHHKSILETKLPHYYIGDFRENPLELIDPIKEKEVKRKKELSKAYRELEETLIADGIYEPNHRFYILESLKCILLFTTSIALALYGPRHILNFVVSGLLLTLMWQQGAFLVHDLAHRYATFDAKFDYVVAVLFSNFCSGTSVGWWKHNHNIHHIITNDPEHDPDLQHMPFFAYSTKYFNSLYSYYYGREMTFDEAAKFMISIQHYTFYIILMFARFNLYFQGINHLLTRPSPMPRLELALTGSFFIWYPALLSTFPDWTTRIVFVLITHCPQAILHLQLLLSHSFMPIESVGDDDFFIYRQLRTSIDIECPEYMDWFHGGLHFQALHHLFPRVPRPHFRKLLVHIKKFCYDNELEHHSITFTGGNFEMVRLLKDVADQVKLFAKVAKEASQHGHIH
ncbi:fatty acid/sphingolipid desaturase [Neoconidiobolus thromboides FSU 785]|nr:fatty acid/sphingolipid desaturase [Neoconidiobolus thromboides FSU 785]